MDLKPLKVIDDTADGSFSSSIIVRSLNEALKNIGLYDEKGESVVSYSTVGSDCGRKDVKAIICLYELAFPEPILKNLGGRPVIGSGLDNMGFALEGGYPANLCYSLPLGVDSKFFTRKREPPRDIYRVICVAESNSRCGLHFVVEAFGRAFHGQSGVELYIKDRFATEQCKKHLAKLAEIFEVKRFVHDTANTVSREEMRKLYESSHLNVFLNQSSTWAMSCLEGMAMGLPLIAMNYSGPANYLIDGRNGMVVEHSYEQVTDSLIKRLVEENGYRNFLFPERSHLSNPTWAKPDIRKASDAMFITYVHESESEDLKKAAVSTARQFTWERSAAQLATIVASLSQNPNP